MILFGIVVISVKSGLVKSCVSGVYAGVGAGATGATGAERVGRVGVANTILDTSPFPTAFIAKSLTSYD